MSESAYGASEVPGALAHESQGPMMVALQQVTAELRAAAVALSKGAAHAVDHRVSAIAANVQTDANGDIDNQTLYTVQQGRRVQLTRLLLDTEAYNAGAPYANALSWVALYRNAAAVGNLLDFGPATAGGPWLPGLFEMQVSEAPMLRGGEKYVLSCNAGPATTRIGVTMILVESTEN